MAPAAVPSNLYVVVSGPPGSGKTTLAGRLAVELGLPLLAKDTIKQALMEILDVPDVEASRRLGRAAVVALLAVAREARGGVIESAWHRQSAVDDLRQLDGTIVEVFCRCDRPTLEERFGARVATRAAGHFDGDRTAAELWNAGTTQPVAGGWPVIEVDTMTAVDAGMVARRVLDSIVAG